MARKQLQITGMESVCQNPECGELLDGKRPNAKTCSPRCRKALQRANHPDLYTPPAKTKQIAARFQKRCETLKRPPRRR